MTDREAITDLIYRYCRAMDRIDREQGYAIWHSDGTADYGEEVYQGTGRGFVDHVCDQHARLLRHSHQVTNIVIELDGDRAGSESYYTTALRMLRGETMNEICVWGRYVDRWSKRDGRWGIEHRVAIRDFDDMRVVTPMSDDMRSRRDRDDPSYAVLKARP
jgi:SnoaL-like domain